MCCIYNVDANLGSEGSAERGTKEDVQCNQYCYQYCIGSEYCECFQGFGVEHEVAHPKCQETEFEPGGFFDGFVEVQC